MPSFYDVQRARTPRPQLRCANHFSFPPTQRYGLLVPTNRSQDQRVNLSRTWDGALETLSERPLQNARSLS